MLQKNTEIVFPMNRGRRIIQSNIRDTGLQEKQAENDLLLDPSQPGEIFSPKLMTCRAQNSAICNLLFNQGRIHSKVHRLFGGEFIWVGLDF